MSTPAGTPATSTPASSPPAPPPDPFTCDATTGLINFQGRKYRAILNPGDGSASREIMDEAIAKLIVEILNQETSKITNLGSTEISPNNIKVAGSVVERIDTSSPPAPNSLAERVDNLFKQVVIKPKSVSFRDVTPAPTTSALSPDTFKLSPPGTFPHLAWHDNSCYMDSVLHMLLSVRSVFGQKIQEVYNAQKRKDPILESLVNFFNAVEFGDEGSIKKAATRLFNAIPQLGEHFDDKGADRKQKDATELLFEILKKIAPEVLEKINPKSPGPHNFTLHQAIPGLRLNPDFGNKLEDLLKDKNLHKIKLNNKEKPPDVLFLTLHRNIGKGVKNEKAIEFMGPKGDGRLNLAGNFVASSRPNSDFEYEVCGIVKHQGETVDSGHYTCKSRQEESGVWLNCDDIGAKVEPVVDNKNPFNEEDKKQVVIVALRRVKKVPSRRAAPASSVAPVTV